MYLSNDKIDVQDTNFNLLANNNSDNSRHIYIFEKYTITTDIIDNKLRINIQEKTEKNIENKKYEKLYTQEELIQINKVFSMFDKIEDSFNFLILYDNNLLIKKESNFCILTIKLDTKELPKNNISDSMIFKIPGADEQNPISQSNNNADININDNSSKLLKINNNLKLLNIESSNSIININNKDNLLDNENDINKMDINSLVQHLIEKVNKLTEENKEIKNRLNVLENNNNELIKIIKENRMFLLKEKNNGDGQSMGVANIKKNKDNENGENNENNNFDINTFFLSQNNIKLNDLENENENSPNFLTRIHTKYLREKTKNKKDPFKSDFKLNKMDIENSEEKNKINFKDNKNFFDKIKNRKKSCEEEDKYLYSNKIEKEEELFDDMNLFQNNKYCKKNFDNLKNNYYGEQYGSKKNIISVDENEEEKKDKFYNNIPIKEDDIWSVNRSNNIVGGVCLPSSKNSPFSNQKKDKKNTENSYSPFYSKNYNFTYKKSDSNRGNDYLI